MGGFAPVFFFPGTLVRTWGTRPGGKACEQARDLSPNQRMALTLLRSPRRLFIRTQPRNNKGEGGDSCQKPSDRMDRKSLVAPLPFAPVSG